MNNSGPFIMESSNNVHFFTEYYQNANQNSFRNSTPLPFYQPHWTNYNERTIENHEQQSQDNQIQYREGFLQMNEDQEEFSKPQQQTVEIEGEDEDEQDEKNSELRSKTKEDDILTFQSTTNKNKPKRSYELKLDWKWKMVKKKNRRPMKAPMRWTEERETLFQNALRKIRLQNLVGK